jgi:hypothetical protein
MSSYNKKQTKSCHSGAAAASSAAASSAAASVVKPETNSLRNGIFVKKFYKNRQSKVDQACTKMALTMEKALQGLNFNMELVGSKIQEISARPTLKDCSTQTYNEEEEEKVSSVHGEHNKFFINIINRIMRVCVCKCGIQTQCKGTTAMRLFVNKHAPGHTNPFFKFVDEVGNPLSDIDLNMCNNNFNYLMKYIETISDKISLENKSSFCADSELIRLQRISHIYSYKISLNPSNQYCSELGLLIPIEILLDISIKVGVAHMQNISATHRALITTKNTYGFNDIVMQHINFFSMRGLIEYAKSEIHKSKIYGKGLQIIDTDKCPLRIIRAINEEDEVVLRGELLKGRSYQLIRFCKEYHNISNDIALMNNEEYLDRLYINWNRTILINRIEVSCPKEKDDWKEWIKSQMEGIDVYSCEDIIESKRVVVLPCGHVVGLIGYLKQLLGYLIYRMNRLEEQPPSFVEDLNHSVDCPMCRKESFVIGNIRSEMRDNTEFGKDIILMCSNPRFIKPISA